MLLVFFKLFFWESCRMKDFKLNQESNSLKTFSLKNLFLKFEVMKVFKDCNLQRKYETYKKMQLSNV